MATPFPPPEETQAPAIPPVNMRTIKPSGDVRFGVFGSLSAMSSATASTLRSTTAGIEPISASGRSSFNQPRCTAQATIAGGVSERRPAKTPIKKESRSVIAYSIQVLQYAFVTYSNVTGDKQLEYERTAVPDYRGTFSAIQCVAV